MQYSVHSPNPFIQKKADQLLPGWPLPILSVLVVLQQCPLALLERTTETERCKNQLRHQFIKFGLPIARQLQSMGYCVELFDPRTGRPLISPPGLLRLDDVAVVRSLLHYPVIDSGGCTLVIHPSWNQSVYPSTIVSSAPPSVLQTVVDHATHPCLPAS